MKRAVATLAVLLLLVGSAMAATSATFTDFNGNVTQDYERSGSGQLTIEGNGERLGQENTYSGSANQSFDFQNVQRNASVTFIGNTSTSTDQRTYSEDFSTLGAPDSSNNVTVNNGNLALPQYTTTQQTVLDTFEDSDLSEYSANTESFSIENGVLFSDSSGTMVNFNSDVSRGQNFTVDFVAPPPSDGGLANDHYFIFGFQDTNNYYQIRLDQNQYENSILILEKFEDGDRTIIDTSSEWGPNTQFNELEVNWTSEGNIKSRYKTPEPASYPTVSGDDSSYQSGFYGFGSDGGSSSWEVADNVKYEYQVTRTKLQGHWEKTYQDNDVDSIDFSQPLSRKGVQYYVGTNETSLIPVSDGGSVDTTGRDLTVRAELTRQSDSPAYTDGFEAIVNEQIIHKTENPSADIDSDGIAEASHSGILDNGEQVTKSIDAQQNFSLQLSSDAGNVHWQYSTYEEGRVYVESVRDGEQTVTLDTYFAEGETYTQSISFTSGEHVYGVQTGDESLTKNVSSLTLNYTLDDPETQNSTNQTSENIVIGDSCDGQKLYYTDVCVPQGIWFYGTRGLSIALPMAGLGGAYRKFS